MSIHVQVIKPTGTRFQFRFPDHVSDEGILSQLATIAHQFGYNGTVKKLNESMPGAPPIDWSDPTSGLVWDNPLTVVAVLESGKDGPKIGPDGLPVEAKRLKGPAADEPITSEVRADAEPVAVITAKATRHTIRVTSPTADTVLDELKQRAEHWPGLKSLMADKSLTVEYSADYPAASKGEPENLVRVYPKLTSNPAGPN